MQTRAISPTATNTVRYRGINAPEAATAPAAPLTVPFSPRIAAPANPASGRSYPASSVLTGTLALWSNEPTTGPYAAAYHGPSAIIRGLAATGRMPIRNPGMPAINHAQLILVVGEREDDGAKQLHAGRLSPAGELIAAGTSALGDAWAQTPVALPHDSFVVAGAQFLQLVAHARDRLDVVQRLDIGPASPPIVTRDGRVIVGGQNGTLRSYEPSGRMLVETDCLAPAHGSAWAHPFELGHGIIVSRAATFETSVLYTTRVAPDGTLTRCDSAELPKVSTCFPIARDQIIAINEAGNVATTYHVDTSGHIRLNDTSALPLGAEPLIITDAGTTAPRLSAYDIDRHYAIIRVSAQGRIAADRRELVSCAPPLVTRDGALVRTNDNGVTVERLHADGTRTPLFRADDVHPHCALAVTATGTVLVPTQNALVALGAPSA